MIKFTALSSCRLLTCAREKFDLPAKDLRWSIEHGRCFVNGRVERFGSTRLHKGDKVAIWPAKRPRFEREESRVLYEDEDLLFYDKPPFISSPDLALLLGLNLVHRLDRDTTGVILFAKKEPAPYEKLFHERKIEKTYDLLVEGIPSKARGLFSGKMRKIGSREGAVIWGISNSGYWSQTEWECIEQGKKYAYIRCRPLTGRTHQIRVHMRALGHPVLGDCEYGSRSAMPGLFRPLLHAAGLSFGPYRVFSQLPEDFIHWKRKLI
ncbi:MAG: RluA family pseudouridine synthase [Chlamydiales bacterium]|nr:RluA family pseudouridine synthase [Chlamydiales bacterium]